MGKLRLVEANKLIPNLPEFKLKSAGSQSPISVVPSDVAGLASLSREATASWISEKLAQTASPAFPTGAVLFPFSQPGKLRPSSE